MLLLANVPLSCSVIWAAENSIHYQKNRDVLKKQSRNIEHTKLFIIST